MKKTNIAELFYKNAGYIAVVLISIVYITSSLIMISTTGKSVFEIIGSGVLSMVVGILINGVFRGIGLQKGEADERVISTNELHSKAVEDIVPSIDKLDSFCESENKIALKRIRTKILAKEGMKYDDYFDEEGVLIQCEPKAEPGKGDAKARKKALSSAIKLKIKPLLASNLTSDGTSAEDPFNFGKTKKEYASGKNIIDIILRIIMAVIFGFFGVSLVSDVNVASLIWNTLQIVMYLCGGIIQMYNSFNWVTDDYRQGVIKKIDYLQKFKIYAEREGQNNV